MKIALVTLGVLIGIAIPYGVDYVMFRDATPVNVTTTYEDGSFTGCMAGGLCND